MAHCTEVVGRWCGVKRWRRRGERKRNGEGSRGRETETEIDRHRDREREFWDKEKQFYSTVKRNHEKNTVELG